MSFIRKKLVTGFLFILITLGQAYPFSVAYSTMSKKAAACCCEEKKTHCGCSHKKIKFKCHSERQSGYKSLCGGKTQEEILSFRTEPFLKSSIQSSKIFHKEFLFHNFLFIEEGYHTPPLSPPPKASRSVIYS